MIRKATATDIDSILHLYHEYMALHLQFEPILINYSPENDSFKNHLASILDNSNYHVLVFEEMAAIKGFSLSRIASMPPIFKSAHKLSIQDIAVCQQCRGKGVGEALVSETVTWAKEKGVTLAETTVHAQNVLAKGFWEKMGFGVTNLHLYKAI